MKMLIAIFAVGAVLALILNWSGKEHTFKAQKELPGKGLSLEPPSTKVNEIVPETRSPRVSESGSKVDPTVTKVSAASPESEVRAAFDAQVRDLENKIPDIETIREEAKKNVHGTPPQYLEFSKAVAPLMEEALVDSGKGQVLFSELNKCATDRALIPQAIQSLCLQNMYRLSKAHSEALGDDFEEAKNQASSEARSFLEFMNN